MTTWTPEKVLALGTPAPELTAAIESSPVLQNFPRAFNLDILAHIRSSTLSARPPIDPAVTETEFDFQTRDNTTIKLRWYRPATPPAKGSPLVVNFHGGGFIIGNLNTSTAFFQAVVKNHGAVVIDVDYRLAPEHPYPTPKNDCWDALQWVSKNYDSLGANPSLGFLVSGVSAGGNAAASMALLARDNKLEPKLTGTFLSVPATVSLGMKLPDEYAPLWLSREQNKDAPILNVPFLDFMMDCYKPDYKSHNYAPAHHPQGHGDLAKTYVVVCGLDPLRDDGIIYEQILRDAGVETKFDAFPGMPHAWWTMLPEMEVSNEYHGKVAEAISWLLEK